MFHSVLVLEMPLYFWNRATRQMNGDASEVYGKRWEHFEEERKKRKPEKQHRKLRGHTGGSGAKFEKRQNL